MVEMTAAENVGMSVDRLKDAVPLFARMLCLLAVQGLSPVCRITCDFC